MRNQWLTLAGVLLTACALRAQQTPAPPAEAFDPANNRLDAVLLRWEQEMKSVQTLVAQCTRTTIDKTFQVTEVYDGSTRFYRPNMAMLHMQKRGKPEVFEKYICTGNYLYEYVPAHKLIRVHELPQAKSGQMADDSFLSFLFGMKADEARRRYDLKLVKEDQWWIYIEIGPRLPNDKADFQKARLVLSKPTYLPRELWFEQPNNNEVKWDIPKIDKGTPLDRTEFTAPQVPQGWTKMLVPRNVEAAPGNNLPPRIIRENQ